MTKSSGRTGRKRIRKGKSRKAPEQVYDSQVWFGTGTRIRKISVSFDVRKGSPTYVMVMSSFTTLSVDWTTYFNRKIKEGSGGLFSTPMERPGRTYTLGFAQLGPGGAPQPVIVRAYGPPSLPTSVAVGNGGPDVQIILRYNVGLKAKSDTAGPRSLMAKYRVRSGIKR
jgi:hypothetical protein